MYSFSQAKNKTWQRMSGPENSFCGKSNTGLKDQLANIIHQSSLYHNFKLKKGTKILIIIIFF